MSAETQMSKRIWSREHLRRRLAFVPTPMRSGQKKEGLLDSKSGNEYGAHRWEDLPHDVLQFVMDLLPKYQGRAYLQMVCKSTRRLDRNFAPPQLDCLFDSEHMHMSKGVNVYLRNMRFGDRGAHAVAQALQLPQNNVVLRLDLAFNGITDEGAESIAAGIVTSPAKIRRIYLDHNNISDRGARALMNAIASHSTMLELDLHGNRLTASGKLEICARKREATNQALATVCVSSQLPSSTYIADLQPAMDEAMRCRLIDWMFELAFDIACKCGTKYMEGDFLPSYFLAVSCFDRYLSQKGGLQKDFIVLLGISCYVVAVSFCERWPADSPKVHALAQRLAFAYTVEHAYTVDAILMVADDIRGLQRLELEQPTAYNFVVRYLTFIGYGEETMHLCNYILSLAALSYPLLQHPPHVVAAAAVLLSQDALAAAFSSASGSSAYFYRWQQRLLHCSGVDTAKDLIPCAEKLADLHASVYSGMSSLSGFRGLGKLSAPRRYSNDYMRCVSKIRPTRPSLLSSPLSFQSSPYVVKRKALSVWKSCESWEKVRKLKRNDVVAPRGVVRKVEGYDMLPIYPDGAVEFRTDFLEPTQITETPDGVAYAMNLLMKTADWTLHGSKRRRLSFCAETD